MTTSSISLLSRAPDFSEVSDAAQRDYKQFFEYTNDEKISQYAEFGSSLEKLTVLTESARVAIHFARLKISADWITQNQWQLNHLSEIKERLAKAIQMKRNYYDNNCIGIITKYFLMLIGQWNNGDTKAIVAAEDFLLFWDSRKPVGKISNPEHRRFGKYFERSDFRTDQLDTAGYFNYNPRRLIETDIGEKINYASLRA